MAQVPTAPAKPNVLRRVRLRLRSYPLIPAFVLLVLLIFPAITADWLAPHDPVHGAMAWADDFLIVGKVVWTSHMVHTEPAEHPAGSGEAV